jgi:hypothetical protein
LQALNGIAIDIICLSVTLLNLHTYGWWLFDLGTVPDWANKTMNMNHTNANLLNVVTTTLRTFE